MHSAVVNQQAAAALTLAAFIRMMPLQPEPKASHMAEHAVYEKVEVLPNCC